MAQIEVKYDNEIKFSKAIINEKKLKSQTHRMMVEATKYMAQDLDYFVNEEKRKDIVEALERHQPFTLVYEVKIGYTE
jgi:hypothetical protein